MAAAICLAVLFALFVAGNIVLFYYLRNRGVRKLCTHQLQDKRNALLEQLEILRAGGFVSVEAGDEEDEDEDILVVDDEDDDEDDESAPQPQNYFGVVDKEEVDETMDAEILTVAKTSAEAREQNSVSKAPSTTKNVITCVIVLAFDAKLRLSGDEVKERYQALMNEISQYKGVKVKSSYRQQRIYKGRKTLGLIVFCGKTLCIALALNPAEYENTKYRGIDKSDKSVIKNAYAHQTYVYASFGIRQIFTRSVGGFEHYRVGRKTRTGRFGRSYANARTVVCGR